MDLPEIRLACLKLAKEQGGTTEEVAQIARIWVDFVIGTSGAKVISAAREFRTKIGANS